MASDDDRHLVGELSAVMTSSYQFYQKSLWVATSLKLLQQLHINLVPQSNSGESPINSIKMRFAVLSSIHGLRQRSEKFFKIQFVYNLSHSFHSMKILVNQLQRCNWREKPGRSTLDLPSRWARSIASTQCHRESRFETCRGQPDLRNAP